MGPPLLINNNVSSIRKSHVQQQSAIDDGLEDFDDASFEGNLYNPNVKQQSSTFINRQNAAPITDMSKSNTS